MAWKFSKPSTSRPPELYGASSSAAAPSAAQLPAVQRDFYLEHPDVAALTPEQVQALRAQLCITIHGDAARCPNPVGSFVQASFPQYILDALLKVGFSTPTAIQRQGWPVAMKGMDAIGLAETGSGKTLTYLLPAIVHVNAQPVLTDGDGPLALVLAPTRELAEQIHEEVVRFGQPCGVKSVCIYGGVDKKEQVQPILITNPNPNPDLNPDRNPNPNLTPPLSRCRRCAARPRWSWRHRAGWATCYRTRRRSWTSLDKP